MSDLNYEAAMYEISEIVRVARDNPKGLRIFLMANYPREWGLTKEQHRIVLSGGEIPNKGKHSYDRKDSYRCKYYGDPAPYGKKPPRRARPCPGIKTDSTVQEGK